MIEQTLRRGSWKSLTIIGRGLEFVVRKDTRRADTLCTVSNWILTSSFLGIFKSVRKNFLNKSFVSSFDSCSRSFIPQNFKLPLRRWVHVGRVEVKLQWSSQGHPKTVFCKISVRRSKYCVEFSIIWGRLKISRWLFLVFCCSAILSNFRGFLACFSVHLRGI